MSTEISGIQIHAEDFCSFYVEHGVDRGCDVDGAVVTSKLDEIAIAMFSKQHSEGGPGCLFHSLRPQARIYH